MDFERWPTGDALDETDISLRAYVAGISDEKLRAYDPEWSDEAVVDWDGNFKSDGSLMLVCCERDVGVGEFRQLVETYLRFRKKAGDSLSPQADATSISR